MRGILCNAFDGIKALSIGEAEEPYPRSDEVLIDVHAASVSYADYLMVCGVYQMRPALPYIPGTDGAGVVVACGDQVTRFRRGDRVCCENWFGSFAERMVAKASMTARLPDNVDFIVGSTIMQSYLTAWYALIERARLQAGETVLITEPPAGLDWLALSSRICSVRESLQPWAPLPRRPLSASTVLMRSSIIRTRTCDNV